MAKSVKTNKGKKILFWIIAVIIFYVLTAANVSQETVVVEKTVPHPEGVQQAFVTEKPVTTTKYKEQLIPYGEKRCEQMPYNLSKKYSYTEDYVKGQKVGICTYNVKNEEDISGAFTFYPQYLYGGSIHDGPEVTKTIEAFGTAKYEWTFNLEAAQTGSCMLQTQDQPSRMKCFYLEPITYEIKQVPYTVEEKKNVTEYKTVTEVIEKQNVTRNVYTNKFFGYRQFFYFGY